MTRRIAIIHPVSAPWVARIFDGIHRYAEEHGSWHIFFIPQASYGAERTAMTLRSLEGWDGDGIILASNDPEELCIAKNWGIPVINLAGGVEALCGIPRVCVDSYQAGRFAANHLIDRNLTNLAYFGWEELWYSRERFRGFSDQAREAGAKCVAFMGRWNEASTLNWSDRLQAAAEWLKTLSLPCGVFAAQDFRAQLLLEACAEAHLRVPDDIAVVGMDNNETICGHSIPKLSSVSRNSERVGYEASAYLERLMNGDTDRVEEILIPPDAVVCRASSDMMYCSNLLVRQAIEYMRAHLRENINIENISDSLGVSKRTLERNFLAAVHYSPHKYLIKMRIMHAQALMKLEAEKPIITIAAESGFPSPPSFYAAFHRHVQQTPSAYRSSLKASSF